MAVGVLRRTQCSKTIPSAVFQISQFQNMFSVGSVEKPIIIITGVKFSDLCLILDFAYMGQASIPQDRLDDFLKAGELLQIRGLKEGRIHFMTKHVHSYTQPQSANNNRSFEQTITSTQKHPEEATAAKRPREEEDVSMQEATEIMKMLLDNSGEIEGEQTKAPIVQPFAVGTPQNNILIRSQNALQPQINFPGPHPSQLKQELLAPAVKEKSGFICRYCGKHLTTAAGIKKHENECYENPDRIMAVCEICNSTVKPSSLTAHKKQKHEAKTKQTTQKIPTAKVTQSDPILTRALAETCTRTQLNAIDSTRPSSESTQGRSSTSDADSPDEQPPMAIPDIKEEAPEPEEEADIDVMPH